MLFERFAIDILRAAQTVKGAQGILRTSWDETWRSLEKAVARGKARKAKNVMPRIGIDEKAFRKGHDYITMIYDLDNSTVEAISNGNDADSGNQCFSQLFRGTDPWRRSNRYRHECGVCGISQSQHSAG